MEDYKTEILDKICYTDLVYEKINKKLNIQLPKDAIEKMIYEIIEETDKTKFQKTGKNIYITNDVTIQPLFLLGINLRKGLQRVKVVFDCSIDNGTQYGKIQCTFK